MRTLFTLLVCCLALANASAQNCMVHLGNNYYEDCKSMIRVGENDVLTFGSWADPIGTVNLDVFDASSGLLAQVRSAKLTKGDAKNFVVKADKGSFTMSEAHGGRVICSLMKVPATQKQNACQVDARLDLYMPGGGFFTFTPEGSNVPFLQYMNDSFFKGSDVAIQL